MKTQHLRRFRSWILLWSFLVICAAGLSPARSHAAIASPPGHAASADGVWSELAMPGGLIDQVAIYDRPMDRMIVFGGISETQAAGSNLTWSWSRSTSPSWTLLDAIDASDPISGLYDATALLDPVRLRMLVFGGTDGALRNTVWALPLGSPGKWARLQPQGSVPSPREGAALVYDPARDRMILFGGNAGGWNTEVWALALAGTPVWTQLAPLGTPPPSVRSAAVFDAPDDRCVIYNGTTVWQLSFAADADHPAWTQRAPGGTPASRTNFTAAYDSTGRRIIVYGGSNGTGLTFGETWALSLSPTPAWAQLLPTGTLPRARFVHSAVIDEGRREMVVFGGLNYENSVQTRLAGTATLTLGSTPVWQSYGGELSPPRSEVVDAGFYDSWRDRLFVTGVSSSNPVSGSPSHRALDLSSASGWDDAPGLFVDDLATAIYDPRFDGMVVFGGLNSHFGTTDGGPYAQSFSGQPGWSGSTGPSPGTSAARKAIYDPVRYRFVMFGGDGYNPGHAVWAIGLASPHASEQIVPPGTSPPDRYPDVVVYDPVRDRLIVFGGWGETNYFNDAWSLNLSGAPAWTALAPTAPPPDTTHYYGVYDPVRDRLVVTSKAGAWALPLAAPLAWEHLSPAGSVPGPAGSEVVTIYDPVRDRMLMQLTPASPVPSAKPYSTTFALAWGEPARPGALCSPGDTAGIAGLQVVTAFDVVNDLAGPRAIGWKFKTDREWPGLPLYGTTIVAGNTTRKIAILAPVPDSAASGNSVLRFTAWFEGGEGFNSECERTLAIDATTAATPAFESMLAEPGLVTLRWDLGGDARLGATIYRRDDTAATWQPLGPATIESNRYAVYRDAAVEPGAVYWYRARLPRPAGALLLAPVRVVVPMTLALALEPPRPNPARELRVAFVLPDSRAATFDVFDVSGRRVAHEVLAGRSAGRRELTIGGAELQAGVYLVRLQQGGRTAFTRAAILR